MNDPIKIIHKFKNNNRRIQYKIYIYIGSLLSKNILNILDFIKEKDFYTTLNTITKRDYQELEEIYGKYWYRKFFINRHINAQLELIKYTNNKKTSLEKKYGKEWYREHIDNPPVKKVYYSFATSYYNYLLINNKIKTQSRKGDIDFRTYGDFNINIDEKKSDNNNFNKRYIDEPYPDTKIKRINLNYTNKEEEDEDEEEIKEEAIEEAAEDINIGDISLLYNKEDIEKSSVIADTSKMISEVINDKKWEKKAEKLEKNYDESQDNLAYDSQLEDVYNKYYITDQYIFKDDTIKTMREKVSMSIPISDKFGKSIRLLPESQYFWSEYQINNKKDAVILGHKWIRKNELLKIDIEPNDNLKVYENLRNNLSYLKDTFGYKIKYEDDENNIIRSYDNYITDNEICMIDIYNELGINYNPDNEAKKNIHSVYINIYYPLISFERFEQILNLLNGVNDKELSFIENQYGTIMNNLKLETYIQEVVEETKLNYNKYEKYFNPSHVLQSIIHVMLQDPKNITGTTSDTKFNLYRIFDNFIVSKDYPFIQFQTPETQLTYKFYTTINKTENQELTKWFENAPYGLSFKIKLKDKKIKTDEKYMTVNLHENGRIDYKINWKEEDQAIIEDVKQSYNYIRDLLSKINAENKKIKFIIPSDDKFKEAFINTIQKFNIPDKFKIDHNDLSDFSRFFFPYVSVEIEPKKREALKGPESVTSKYGTYLRYKRIAKYDNRNKMHLRIIYFLRNYELTDRELIDEIAKQFNITMEVAAKEIDYVRDKFPKVIKTKATLKKFKVLPKFKKAGLGIDIQGKEKDNYKIKITGARNKEQLDEISDFIKVLIYLYIETYLHKKPEYQKLKDILKGLTKIAKRRNKVIDYVEYEPSTKAVKSMISLDKARLGFKPEKGQNQWTRSCQNSGDDKRRPDIIPETQLNKLIDNGFELNKETGFYEKLVKNKYTDGETYIKAIKLQGADNTSNYYTCNPDENKENIHIGFLSKSNNPNDLCMPCCFKKDQMYSNNKEKKEYYLKCVGEQVEKREDKIERTLGDKLYILQESNKIQNDRFIMLPKYLDVFFNKIWEHDHKIKNHYLVETNSGYFFKYTVKNEPYYFLAAIANIYNLTIDDIINKLINFMEKDKDNRFFTYLNNGDIAESFKTREEYINYLNNSEYLEYDIIGELTSIPNVISPKGINYFIINKQIIISKKTLERETIKEKYYIDCLNTENYNNLDKDRDTVLLIKDDKYYFPIYFIKRDDVDQKLSLVKYYNDNRFSKIFKELRNYYDKSCQNNLINEITTNSKLYAKNIIEKLDKIKVIKQFIDDRHKCRYLLLDNNLLLPVKPSGISYDYPFSNIKSIKNYVIELNKNIKLLDNVNKVLQLGYLPTSVLYDEEKQDKIKIVSIVLENELIIPISNELSTQKEINKLALAIKFQPQEEIIDKMILDYDNEIIYDNRYKQVKERNYMNESYNLYRLELSLYLSKNNNIRNKIIDIVRDNRLEMQNKKHELRKILFEIIDPKLEKEYRLQSGGQKDTLAFLTRDIPDLKNYMITNLRDYCSINNKDKCISNPHCSWKDNKCKLQLLENLAIDFVNRIIEEMIQDGIKFKEIIQEGNYYVSDIVDYTQYTYRPNQKIIKASNFNVDKLMSELFGKDKIPTIGKKQQIKKQAMIIEDEYPELIELGKQYIQEIIPNKDSIIRAYINCYYWIKNPLYDTESRNLGYYNNLQSDMVSIFKTKIIDFLQDNYKKYPELSKYFKDDENFFISDLNKFRKNYYNTNGKIELFILSHLIPLPIVVYDNFSNIKYLYLQGEIAINNETIKNFTSEKNINKTIYLKFNFENTDIPKDIYSIYYL